MSWRAQAHPHIAPMAPLLSRCRRADAILSDIAFHSGGAPSPPLPSTEAYVKGMTAACGRSPTLLVAYAYTMHAPQSHPQAAL